ncbi:MAG: redoxin domain-containing protein [Desulfobacterales bacterium]|nr:redoxin domain-containing protein [Desulfobacterales bacterium]
MTLKAKIDAYKKEFLAKAPPEAAALMQRATDDLQNSGILGRAVQVGALAPDFQLTNTDDAEIALGDLLDKGALVLSFYRGRW